MDEFHIIDEENSPMYEYDCIIAHEHYTAVEVYDIDDDLYKYIIDRHEYCREEYIVTKIRWKYKPIGIKYPYKYTNRNQKEEKFECHDEHEDPMSFYHDVLRRVHRRIVMIFGTMLFLWF